MNIKEHFADIALCVALFALSLLPFTSPANNGQDGFTENKGQIHDQYRKPNPAVKYLMNRAGMNVQLRSDGFSYDTYVVETDDQRSDLAENSLNPEGRPEAAYSSSYRFHRIDLHFVHGNAYAQLIADGESEDYLNYYTDVTGEAGATFVNHYSTVTYKDVWPDVDVRCTAGEDGFKYDVIVRPGGDLTDVRFEVNGARISENSKGELVFAWAEGNLDESIPASWVENGRRKMSVDVRYDLATDGSFGFRANEHGQGTLVIDPFPTNPWATYCGGTGNEVGRGVGMDANGNSYMTGETSSTNVIATSGTYDATFNGGTDAYLIKYNVAGTKLWGTYCGGSGSDVARDVAVETNGIAAICGSTTSNTGIATTGAHQVSFGGGTGDAFLVRFQSNGTRIWGSYLGGAAYDIAYGIAVGINGELAFCGQTQSTTGMASPIAADAVQSGGTDAFVALFTNAGARTWSTYLGGGGNETANAVAFTGAYPTICGVTTSTSGIATASAYDATHNGSEDAFIARYHSNGAKLQATYFGGTGNDAAKDIAFTMLDRVVVVGSTASTTQISTAGSAQPVFGGGSTDGFIAAFNLTALHRVWGTYCGGTFGGGGFLNLKEWLGSVAATTGGSFVVVGPNFSTDLGTPDSWSPTGTSADGSRPSFAAGYSSAGGKQWAGYPEFQKGLAVAGDASSVIVAGSGIDKSPHIPLPNAFQPNWGGGSSEAFIQKLDLSGSARALVAEDRTFKAAVVDGMLKILDAPEEETMLLTLRDATGRELLIRTWRTGQPIELPTTLVQGIYIATLRAAHGRVSTARFFLP